MSSSPPPVDEMPGNYTRTRTAPESRPQGGGKHAAACKTAGRTGATPVSGAMFFTPSPGAAGKPAR